MRLPVFRNIKQMNSRFIARKDPPLSIGEDFFCPQTLLIRPAAPYLGYMKHKYKQRRDGMHPVCTSPVWGQMRLGSLLSQLEKAD